MKPCTLTPTRPIRDMNRIRSEVQAWTRLGLAAMVLGLLTLSGCDLQAPLAATTATDSAKVDTGRVEVRVHEWALCQIGTPPEVCPNCQPAPYIWGVEVALSNGDTIRLADDSTTCKIIGNLPDTLQIHIDGTSQSGSTLDRWLMVDSMDVTFRYRFPTVPDSMTYHWRVEADN